MKKDTAASPSLCTDINAVYNYGTFQGSKRLSVFHICWEEMMCHPMQQYSSVIHMFSTVIGFDFFLNC